MMRMMKWSMIALSVSAGTLQMAMASPQDDSNGFIQDSTLTSKTRVMYMNSSFSDGAAANYGPQSNRASYRQDSGLSELLQYASGFTQGTLGVGVDAFGMGTVKFDGGAGRSGNGLFGVDSDGNEDHTQSAVGAAIKFRLSNTVLKWGDQFVASPVFSTSDIRLLPEVATGTLITSNEIKDLTLTLGHFTQLRSQTGDYDNSVNGRVGNSGSGPNAFYENFLDGVGPKYPGLISADIVGATYKFNDQWTGGVAASNLEDYFKKQYVSLTFTQPITDTQALNFDLNAYNTRSQGEALYGKVDNKIWSLAAAYRIDAHKFTLAYQSSTGSTGYSFGIDGDGTIFLANSVQVSNFDNTEERSLQARYDLNMATYGVPGLTFSTRYVYGEDIETGGFGEGKEHEWDAEAKYVLQQGPVKNLSLRLRSAVYRNNDALIQSDQQFNFSNNDVRLIIEYPLNIL